MKPPVPDRVPRAPSAWLRLACHVKKRNAAAHIKNEDQADDLLLIQGSFTLSFSRLEKTLEEKNGRSRKRWK